MVLNDREMMAMLLDLCTLPCTYMDKNVRNEAVRLLKLAYVEFGINCVLYDRQQEADAKKLTVQKMEEEDPSEVVALRLKQHLRHSSMQSKPPLTLSARGVMMIYWEMEIMSEVLKQK